MDDMTNLDPKQIKQMIMLLQAMLPKQQEEEEPVANETVTDNQLYSNPKIQTSHKRPKPSLINKFDSMIEAKMHKEDVEIDKKLNVYGPTPRTRKYNPVPVRCRVCGKTEKVNPNLVSEGVDRYKCNACSRGAG